MGAICLPLPSTGIGGIRLEEIFGKASKNNNLIIPFEDIYSEGYQIGEDNRSFFSAFFRYLIYSEDIPIRNSAIPSAIIKFVLKFPFAKHHNPLFYSFHSEGVPKNLNTKDFF